METVRAAGQVFGPGLGGWLVALAGAANVVLIQAATFVVSAATLIAIKTHEPVMPVQPDRPRLWAQIKEGLFFVARTPLLRAMAITSAASNFAFAIASAVSFIFMVQAIGLSPRQSAS